MTKTHDMTILHSSVESDWRTPDACFQALHAEFGFDMDAAANAVSSHCGPHFFGPGSGIATNALAWDWLESYHLPERVETDSEIGYRLEAGPRHHPRRFFLNPPFSRTKANAYRTGRIRPKGSAEWLPHPVDLNLARVYEVESWLEKAWTESRRGATVVVLCPFAPQTDWYRRYVYGQNETGVWLGHAAQQERRLTHRISFLTPDGQPAANAGVNTAVLVYTPMTGVVGPWVPMQMYWSYR